jgi:hypothetical protein
MKRIMYLVVGNWKASSDGSRTRSWKENIKRDSKNM